MENIASPTSKYTPQDTAFLRALKLKGVGPEEAFARLRVVKLKTNPELAETVKSGGLPSMISPPSTAELKPGVIKSGEQINKENEPQYFGKGVVDFSKGVSSLGANAAATVGEGLGKTVSTIGQVVDPVTNINRLAQTVTGDPKTNILPKEAQVVEGAGDLIKQGTDYLGKTFRESTAERLGNDETSLAAQAGNVLGSAANVIGGAAIGGGLGTQAGTKAAGALSNVERVGDIAHKALPVIGSGLGSTEGVVAATEGRPATAGELATGLAIDASVGLASKAANKLGDYFFSKIVPTTPLQAGKDAAKGLNLGEVISKETGVSLSRSQVQKKITERVKTLSNEIDSLIKEADSGQINGVIKFGEKVGFTADDLLPASSIDKVLKNKKLQLKFGDVDSVKTQIASTIDEFKKTVGDTPLNLEQVQNLKKQLGSSLAGFYSKTGDAKATAKELVNDIIRKNAKNIIEENIAPAAEINKRLQGLITAEKRMGAKGPYSGYLTDVLAGLGYSGAQGAAGQNDPASYAKNVLYGILLKRAAGSTLAKTAAGQALKEVGKAAPIVSAGLKSAATKLTPSK